VFTSHDATQIQERGAMQVTQDSLVRIAMWSGPRNISTAMMRSFENRDDCAVWDEPLYAVYLKHSGVRHPMHEEIVAAGVSEPQDVERALLGPVPGGASLFYQKHMLHHMLDSVPRTWFAGFKHAFLIRHPEKVVASYAKKRAQVDAADLGFGLLEEIYRQVCDTTGQAPPILDSDTILGHPDAMLCKLCKALDIPFTHKMLAWPPGKRESDGVWGDHWYGAVWRSTGFQKPGTARVKLSASQQNVADACRPAYERFASLAVTPESAG
jgi:hypothetical protein